MFGKEDRSTFKYWFAHWCAFNMTALNLKCWKFKYLFHDWYKPWLKLFMPYEKLQKFHRYHSNHHLEYHYDGDKHHYDEIDWETLAIDWECSRFTKNACPRNAHQEARSKIKKHPELEFIFETYLFPVLRKLDIY